MTQKLENKTDNPMELLIEEIRNLISKKQYNEAFERVELFLDKKSLAEEQKTKLLMWKHNILNLLERRQEAYEIAKIILEILKKTNNPEKQLEGIEKMIESSFWVFDPELGEIMKDEIEEELRLFEQSYSMEDKEWTITYLKQKADMSTRIGLDNDAISFYKEALELANKLRLVKQEASLLSSIGDGYINIGDYDKAKNYNLQGLSKFNILNDKWGIVERFWALGTISLRSGEYDEAIKYGNGCIRLYQELNHEFNIGGAHLIIGWGYSFKGLYNQALLHARKGLEIQLKYNNILGIHFCYTLLGDILIQKGEFDEAEKFLDKNIENLENSRLKQQLALTYNYKGLIQQKKGHLDSAENYYDKALILREEIAEKRTKLMVNTIKFYDIEGDIALSFIYLILINLEQSNEEKIQNYLARFQKLKEKHPELKRISQYLEFTEFLILLDNRNLEKRKKAEIEIEQILDEKNLPYEISRIALLKLCEYNLKKLQIESDNIITIQKIRDNINKLLDVAKKQNSYLFLAETYLLQSQIFLINLEINNAINIIEEAQQISLDHEMRRLSLQISNEYDFILDQLTEWESFTLKLPSIAERMELTHIEEMLYQLLHYNGLQSDFEREEESPELFFILDEDTTVIFAEKLGEFIDVATTDLLLMEARQSFMKKENLRNLPRRFRFNEHTVLLTKEKKFIFGYAFVGKTYIALEKIKDLVDIIKESSSIWEALKQYSINKTPLNISQRIEISQIMDKILQVPQ